MNKTLKLEILFEAGSDFQFQCAQEIFEGIGKAVSEHLRSRHQLNKVIYSTGIEEDGIFNALEKEMDEGVKFSNEITR